MGLRVTKITGSSSDYGIISTSVTVYLNYNQYSAITDLRNFQFTVTHALGFSFSTSLLLATEFNTETNASNHYEILPVLVQLRWAADSPELDPIL
jgi:hypothetical protein